MSDHQNMKPPSLWIPEQDPCTRAVLGKLGEEANELGAIIFRCLIQGVDEKDPETGELNVMALSKEIADVLGLIDLATSHLALDMNFIMSRAQKKNEHKRTWIGMLRQHTEE